MGHLGDISAITVEHVSKVVIYGMRKNFPSPRPFDESSNKADQSHMSKKILYFVFINQLIITHISQYFRST